MARKPALFLVCAFEVALILFLGAWTAWANNHFQKHAIISPPSCINNLGETVKFKNQNAKSANIASGMAKRDEAGEPVVYRFAYQNSPHALQRFIDFHECAHHQTGDVDLPHPPRNSPDHMMNESIADCIATLRMRDELDKGSEILLQSVINLMDAMRKVGFPDSTLNSRKSNILNCLEKQVTAQTFLDGILRYRGLK